MGAIRRTSRLLPAALAIAALSGGGCGGDDSEPASRPVETLDKPARLPAGWRTAVNRVAGFSIGVPPGWVARQPVARTVLRSPDGLAAVSVAADRTDEALELPLQRYAVQTAKTLGDEGLRGLRVANPESVKGRYPGALVKASGTQAKTGVDQKVEVIVLRRPRIAVYPILIARSAARERHSHEVTRIVRSLRGRPPELGV